MAKKATTSSSMRADPGASWRDLPPLAVDQHGRLPVSWADPRVKPAGHCRCACCDGTIYWQCAPDSGWCCARCHPHGGTGHLLVDTTAE